MGLREELDGGGLGVRLSLPASLELLEEAPRALLLRDPERQVAWELGLFPSRLDLEEATLEVLRRDVEAEAREAFRASYEQIGALITGADRAPPRTRDAGWSPVVELERVAIGGASALRLIHRLTYEPGHEMILGRLLIPLATGVFEIAASNLSRTTGYRESARAAVSPGASGALTQKDLDDPTYDILFAEHPLTLVRAALRWLEDEEGGALGVSAPMPAQARGEVELTAAGCAITPPPRYLPLPAGALPVSPTLSMLTRVGLSATSPRTLDVWRLADERITDPERGAALLRLAQANAEAWAGEGASDIECKASKLPDEDGRAQVTSQLRFKANGRPTLAAARWFADRDGVVFRVTAGAGPWVPKKELQGDVDAVVRSLRRLDAPEKEKEGRKGKKKQQPEEPPRAKRKWWPFG